MYNIIKLYVAKLTKEEVNNFAMKKNIMLNDSELTFVYDFIKKNWEQVIRNPQLLNLERYKNQFSEDNFQKIKKLFLEYSAHYANYL